MAHSKAMARSALRASKPRLMVVGTATLPPPFGRGVLRAVMRRANLKLMLWATRYLRKRGVK